MSISEMRNTTTGKVVGFLAALTLVMSLVFGATYAPAQAQTEEELLALITQLTAQIEALQAQLGGGTVSGDFDYVFLNDLSMGSTGTDVLRLQQYLNTNAATQVATTGVGAPGTETSYYGSLTANAVTRYQELNRASILTPLGLASGTGYFGPSTRAHMNGEIAVGVDDGGDDSGDDNTDNGGGLSGGEAVIQNFDLSPEDDAAEGENNAEVAVIEYDVEGGDAELNRVDLIFSFVGNTEDDPEDVIEEITLWADGEEIGSTDADDDAYWSDEGSDAYSIRISGLDYVTRMGDSAEITVAVTLANSIDGAGTGVTTGDVSVMVPDSGLRFVDAEGIIQYAGDVTDTVTFMIEAEGADDSLDINNSTSDPDATTLQIELDGDGESDEYTVFVFDMETGENDVTVDEVEIVVVTTADDYADVVASAVLVIDGQEFDSPDEDLADPDAAVLTFDLDNLDLDGDEEYEAEVILTFNDAGDVQEGVETVQVSVDDGGIEAEGVDDITVTGGTVTGEAHTLSTSVALVDASSQGSDVDETGEVGTFSFEFTVEAEGDDVVLTVADVVTSVLGPTGQTANAVETLTFISGDATEAPAGTFTIEDGDSATFTLDVVVTPQDAGDNGTYRVRLDSVEGTDVDLLVGPENLFFVA